MKRREEEEEEKEARKLRSNGDKEEIRKGAEGEESGLKK